jgi:nucleoside-diphosphate-sugar epimerase
LEPNIVTGIDMTSDARRRGCENAGAVLVTGGAGFIGAHLCRRLRSEGCEVHATSRQRQPTDPLGTVWWQADMADAAEARRVLSEARPSVVFHLAGSVGAGADVHLVLPTYHSLATSTVNLLLAAPELGCRRIVLAGSFTEPAPGTDDPVPGSPYGAAKWVSSAYGRMFHALYGAPVAILRPFMTYGPGQNPAKLIPTVTRALLRGEAPKLSSGRTRADWVYISDVIDGFVVAMHTPGLEGATLDLGTGTLTPVRSVVEELVAIVGTDAAPVFGALPERPAENEIAAITEPAARRLGWRAATPLKDGLRQTVEWHRRELTTEQGRPAGAA